METKTKNLINNLFTYYPMGFMVESKNGKLYLLHDHHKHLNPERDSIRMVIGSGKLDKQIKYISNPL